MIILTQKQSYSLACKNRPVCQAGVCHRKQFRKMVRYEVARILAPKFNIIRLTQKLFVCFRR